MENIKNWKQALDGYYFDAACDRTEKICSKCGGLGYTLELRKKKGYCGLAGEPEGLK